MGEHSLEISPSDKYLGDQISEKRTAARITETIDKRLPGLENKINYILEVAENPCLMGFKSAKAQKLKFESELANKLLTNSESWLGLHQTHLDKLQEFQDRFLRRVFQVTQSGTPKWMLELDGQMVSMKWRVVERRLRVLGKTMDKDENNLRKQALLAGHNICNGEHLLAECINMCKDLKIEGKRKVENIKIVPRKQKK